MHVTIAEILAHYADGRKIPVKVGVPYLELKRVYEEWCRLRADARRCGHDLPLSQGDATPPLPEDYPTRTFEAIDAKGGTRIWEGPDVPKGPPGSWFFYDKDAFERFHLPDTIQPNPIITMPSIPMKRLAWVAALAITVIAAVIGAIGMILSWWPR